MDSKILYQAVDNRDNADDVERFGPFLCQRNPWLGNGYYFWDTFIELAHWWGRQGYNSTYMVCQASCLNNLDRIFDLVGNTTHMQIMKKYKQILEERKPDTKITPAFIIMHMKNVARVFDYAAIRACGVDSVNYDCELKVNRLKFRKSGRAYLDLTPAIQICIIDKKQIELSNYKIVYPMECCTNYTI